MQTIELDQFNKLCQKTKKDTFRIRLFSYKDGNQLTVPAAVLGTAPKPVIILISAIHGDEINGVYINHLLYNKLDADEVEGKIIFLPLANPMAFIQRNRVSSIDHIDMNRTFSFIKKRKPTEHLAGLLFEEIISQADVVFDLHSGGPGEYLPVVETVSQKAVEEAVYLNLGSYILFKKEGGSLVSNCEMKGITAFSVEMGSALRVNRKYCQLFVDGFINYLKYKKMMKGPDNTRTDQKKLTGKVMVPAETDGFFQAEVDLGTEVKKSDRLGWIEPLFKKDKVEVKAPKSGQVIYLRVEASIGEGESIAHIAY